MRAGDRSRRLHASGSNFSAGDWYVPRRAGSWRRWAAPAGGSASVAGGALWLAGGPGNDRLYRSTDGGATWSRASLPRLGDGAVAGLSAPFALGNQVVLPVTVANGSRTAVEFLMSRDRGASWARLASFALAGEVGAGVRVPTAVCPSGVLVAVAPNGSQVVRARATGGKPQVVPARGLPSAVMALSMIDAKVGWARWANSSCRQGTTDCATRTGMVITYDGGGTWAPASPR